MRHYQINVEGNRNITEKQEEPKIIIDEDWKSQVQAEKEAAETAKNDAKSKTDETQADEPPKAQEPAVDEQPQPAGGPLPEASLAELVMPFASQAMMAMGQLPDPEQGHAVVRPDVARHYIDLVGLLQDKTKGNLTPEEENMMKSLLYELRMQYVNVSNQKPTS